MSFQVNAIGSVVTIRLDGRVNGLEVVQEIRNTLDRQTEPTIVILDLTLSAGLDQQFKTTISRVLQHHNVARVGICGVKNTTVVEDVKEFLPVLRRIRQVAVTETESDLYLAFGLSKAQPQVKLSGMLARLKKQ